MERRLEERRQKAHEEMMSKSVSSLEDDEENEEELKVWEQLLESLESERDEIEKAIE